MDLTLFLFDSRKTLRGVFSKGIARCVHDERNHTLSAEIPIHHAARPGEYLGLACVDGRFRIFCIDYADEDEDTATTAITATDAAVDELSGTIISRAEAENITAEKEVREIIAAAGWTVGVFEADEKTGSVKSGMVSAWDALSDAGKAYNMFVEPHYTFAGNRITGKTVDVLAKKPVYRGRLVEHGNDASSIRISYGKRPRPAIYPIGADGLNIAGVVWSKETGDPVDKPAGQLWIGVPEAVEEYGERGQTYEEPNITDANELARKAWEKAKEAAKPEITATARISDMEMIAGQDWKKIRMFDLVRVRPKYGQDAEEQAIRIERDYVRYADTKITLGKEQESSAKQVKALLKSSAVTASRLSSHGRGIGANTTLLADTNVRLYELDGYTRTELSNVSIQLSAQEAAIVLKASREDLAETDRKTSEALIRLDAAESEILLKASLEQVAGVESKVDEVSVRLNAAEKKIELKADYIDLQGYVTAEQLETTKAEIEVAWSELIRTDTLYVTGDASVTNTLTAGKISASGGFRLNGRDVSTTTVPVVTEFTQASGQTAPTTDITFLLTVTGTDTSKTVAA